MIRWLKILSIILITLSLLVTIGCKAQEKQVPLPTSAKNDSQNNVIIPFPFTDKFTNDSEQWIIDRDTSNKIVLKVLFDNKEVSIFHLNNVGVTRLNGTINLGGNVYTVISANINNDKTNSGFITLKKN